MVASHIESYLSQMDIKDQGLDIDSYASSILDATRKRTDINEVIYTNCNHLEEHQQEELESLLLRHINLYDDTLGKFPGEPMCVELKKETHPAYKRPWPVL